MPDNPEVGDRVEVTGTFKNAAGALADPTNIFIQVLRPNGSTITDQFGGGGSVIKASTGVYTFTFLVNLAGLWKYRWRGEGTIEQARERKFTVRPISF